MTDTRDAQFKNSILTVPNVICFVRLVGSIVLFAIAIAGYRYWFVGLYIVLNLSDWIDGRLARWLHQRSDFGARLDSVADATLYAALMGGAALLSWELLQHELIWIAVGFGSYALTTGAGLLKYGRVPSYHTYAAKATQGFALVAGVCLVLEWSVWPLRVAAIAVTLTNLESTAITCVLKDWRADVLTLFYVWPKNPEAVDQD